jgi:hypothetical protein
MTLELVIGLVGIAVFTMVFIAGFLALSRQNPPE